MNKKISRLAGVALGLSMAVAGIGVLASVNATAPEIKETKADDPITYNLTLTGETKGWSTSGTTRTLNGVPWTYSSSTYIGCNGSRIQIGSGNNPQTSAWTIQTPVSSFFSSGKKISSIAITAYTTAETATYGISAGGSSVKSGSLATSSTTYTASSLNVTSGNIVITMTGSSDSKAMYLSNIAVTYEDASLEPSVTFSNTAVSLKTNNAAGVTKSVATANVTNVEYLWSTNDSNITLENESTSTVTIKPNTDSAGSATVSLLVTGDNIDDFESSFTVNLVEPASYTITITANNCTYTGASTIIEDEEATIEFTADDGYVLPGSVTSISGAAVKSFADGELVIQNPTGNVSITMTAVSYDNDYSIVDGGSYKISHTKSSTKYFVAPTFVEEAVSESSAPSLATNSWDAAVFTFALVGDNQFRITTKIGSTKYYLYSTSSNNGVRFSTLAAAKADYWTLSDPDTTGGRTGSFCLKSNNGSRFLTLYLTQDFRGYTSSSADNRTENTDLELYDDAKFAVDVLSSTNTICSIGYNNEKDDFSAMWKSLAIDYANLQATDQTDFAEATADESGTDLQRAAARYDYLVAKYGLTDFAERNPAPLGGVANISVANYDADSTMLWTVVAFGAGLSAIGAFTLIRRRKEN